MEFLINADVSYVLLILGFLIAILALLAPGTGLLEVAALITLALAAYGIINLPLNLWALAIMALGLVPMGLALGPMKQPTQQRTLMVLLAVVAFLLGAALLYRGSAWLLAVNPLLIFLLSPLVIGLSWIVATKAIEAVKTLPAYNLDRLVGMTGQVTSDIHEEGTVYVDGEEWTATSKTFLPAGTPVRVVRRDGLALEVERFQS